jgi:uncharacterized metal-binding protein YceD (DUF177 family)
MKALLRNLRRPLEITISGEEPWLEGIYRYFPTPSGAERPPINSKITIVPVDSLNGYRLVGTLKYAPFVQCGRCAVRIQWPIAEEFELFLAEKPTRTGDSEDDLSLSDLSEYFVENDEVDLEEILNEQVHLAIPAQTIRRSEDEMDRCLSCGEDLGGEQVYGHAPEDDPTNPFAMLKNFKPTN